MNESPTEIEIVLKVHGKHTRIELSDDGDGVGLTDVICFDITNPKPVARMTLTDEELRGLAKAIELRLKVKA